MKYKLVNDDSIKIPYYISDLKENNELIDELLRKEKCDGEIERIKLGRAALMILSNSKYKDKLSYKEEFDPVHSDEEVNPIIFTGYRLSSYMMHITIGSKLMKLIARNPKTGK